MKEKILNVTKNVWFSIGLNLFAAAVNVYAALAYPDGPFAFLNWIVVGVTLINSVWLYAFDKSNREWDEITKAQELLLEAQGATMKHMLESLKRSGQVQVYRSNIQKFMDDQDDDQSTPPKVH